MQSALTFRQGLTRYGKRHVVVRLIATPQGEAPVRLHGSAIRSFSAGHLAWALPVMIVFAPIGTIIGVTVLNGKSHDVAADSFIAAADKAAQALAKAIVAHRRRSGRQVSWKVQVSLPAPSELVAQIH